MTSGESYLLSLHCYKTGLKMSGKLSYMRDNMIATKEVAFKTPREAWDYFMSINNGVAVVYNRKTDLWMVLLA